MSIKKDIESINEIVILVNEFYDKVEKDDLLGPVFERVINGKWEPHLEKMYRFWETILLDNHSYFGSPFPPHTKLGIQAEHFDRWLLLFKKTIDENFEGEKAKEAKWRADKMAQIFQHKLDYLQQSNTSSS